MKPEQRISISLSNIVLIISSFLLLILLWQVRSLIVLLMVAVVLAASISPLVNITEKMKFPRWLGVIIVYLTLISGLISVALTIGPPVLDQIEKLLRQLPLFSESISDIFEDFVSSLNQSPPDWINQIFDTKSVASWVIRSSQQLLLRSYSLTKGVLGGVVSLILALFISGYMLADSKTLINGLVKLFPQPWDKRLENQVVPVTQRMGGYIRGRIIVSAILGIATTTGLGFLGLKDFSLGLGAIASVTNLIPFIGPILGAIPALIVAIAKGGWLFLWVIILYYIIQNVETYVLDPLLVGSSVGVHPLYQLLSVLVGIQLLGIIGALIVPPWFAGGAALVENLYLKPKLEAENMQPLVTNNGDHNSPPVTS
ncbi:MULTISPECIES: AI-2E family transporter [Okeania]|uniref:AI-2E family transporter n=1 Tax=Okeania hirsuta TaxID=1458930 RepID=A0A3N6NK09_9CYAN|nr:MULTISPECIES: AI-2E family transporter [Okeania]NET77669.1 AI-2E family transporter [Okeania sp. SIO1F9]RQH16863.1 AI-2E family transporter [Okeania hirsuta]RQH17354.1 AI-2E family transporter [Okeania hirsuta]